MISLNPQNQKLVDDYLSRLRQSLSALPEAERNDLVAELRTHIEESLASCGDDERTVHEMLRNLGEPEQFAASLRGGAELLELRLERLEKLTGISASPSEVRARLTFSKTRIRAVSVSLLVMALATALGLAIDRPWRLSYHDWFGYPSLAGTDLIWLVMLGIGVFWLVLASRQQDASVASEISEVGREGLYSGCWWFSLRLTYWITPLRSLSGLTRVGLACVGLAVAFFAVGIYYGTARRLSARAIALNPAAWVHAAIGLAILFLARWLKLP